MKEDKDEILLNEFFAEARGKKIADNGFSDNVMQRIESMGEMRVKILSRFWAIVCSILGMAFVVFSAANAHIKLYGTKEVIGIAVAHIANIAKHVSEFDISQIPQFVYPIPLTITILFAVAAIKHENNQFVSL